jgi:hypothetical protein
MDIIYYNGPLPPLSVDNFIQLNFASLLVGLLLSILLMLLFILRVVQS